VKLPFQFLQEYHKLNVAASQLCVLDCLFAGKPVKLPRSSRLGLANKLVDLARQVGLRLYIVYFAFYFFVIRSRSQHSWPPPTGAWVDHLQGLPQELRHYLHFRQLSLAVFLCVHWY
jgi:hypothetical protein